MFSAGLDLWHRRWFTFDLGLTMSHGLVSQSGGYVLLNAAIAHEFSSPNAHGDDLGTGGLGGLGGVILVIGRSTMGIKSIDCMAEA